MPSDVKKVKGVIQKPKKLCRGGSADIFVTLRAKQVTSYDHIVEGQRHRLIVYLPGLPPRFKADDLRKGAPTP